MQRRCWLWRWLSRPLTLYGLKAILCLLVFLVLANVADIDIFSVLQADHGGKPHILFIIADQLRWDALQLGGDSKVFAPNIRQLASEGMSVRYAYSSTPSCTPARAAILTGKSPWHHGMLGFGKISPKYPMELPSLLARGGYRTAIVGKNHFGWNDFKDIPVLHGFQTSYIYDGSGIYVDGGFSGEYDHYSRWFQEHFPGVDHTPTGAGRDRWNGWRGSVYGFDEFYHPTAWVGRTSIDFIRQHASADWWGVSPFFLKVSFHRPHSPYDPPQRLLDKVAEVDLPPQRFCKAAKSKSDDTMGGDWCLQYEGKGFVEGDEDDRYSHCASVRDSAWCGAMPSDEVTFARRAYWASVMFVDEWIGKILDELDRWRLREKTWILFTSDHGDSQGDMYLWRKGHPYDSSSRVPLILRWPAQWVGRKRVVPRGTIVEPPVVAEMRDILHTFVDAAGLAHDTDIVPPHAFEKADGKSLLCLLVDPTGKHSCSYRPNPGPWRSWLDLEHNTVYNQTVHWSALTDGKMKYIYRAFLGDEQLFDLSTDPFETVNRAPDANYQAEMAKWRKRLVHQFEEEGRGEEFVQDGQLVQRTTGLLYSPHFPTYTELDMLFDDLKDMK